MSPSDQVKYCSQRRCQYCFDVFLTPRSKDFHEEIKCNMKVPPWLQTYTKGSGLKTRLVKDVLLDENTTNKSDSESDISEVEKKVAKEVRDTDPELSSVEEEDEFNTLSNQICRECGLCLEEVKMYTDCRDGAMLEEEGIKKLEIQDSNLTLKCMNYVVYDKFNHLSSFDKGLIRSGKDLYLDGLIEYAGKMEEFRRIGPLQEWWYLEDEEEVQTFLTSKRNYHYMLVGRPREQHSYFYQDYILRMSYINLTKDYLSKVLDNQENYKDDLEAYLDFILCSDGKLNGEFVRTHVDYLIIALSQEILDTEVIKSLHTKPSKRTKSIKQSRKRALEQQVSADPSTSRSLTTGRLGRSSRGKQSATTKHKKKTPASIQCFTISSSDSDIQMDSSVDAIALPTTMHNDAAVKEIIQIIDESKKDDKPVISPMKQSPLSSDVEDIEDTKYSPGILLELNDEEDDIRVLVEHQQSGQPGEQSCLARTECTVSRSSSISEIMESEDDDIQILKVSNNVKYQKN